MNNPFSLTGKTILVTGASSGIGKSIAIECSKAGASVIVTGRDKVRLEQTHAMLEGISNSIVVADLTVEEDLERVVESSQQLDGLVHCAGVTDPVPFQFVDEKKIQGLFSINFFSPVLLSRKLMTAKKIQRGSSVVFISSVSGIYCSAVASSMYSASKGAVNGLVKGMALDLAAKNIRVNSVCPGMIETDIFHGGQISPEQLEEDKKRYPLKRYGRPEEVAYAVIYLLSDAAAWLTGSNILIDGGYTLL